MMMSWSPIFVSILAALIVISVRAQTPFTNTAIVPSNPLINPNYVNAWQYLSPVENEYQEFTNVPTTLAREGAAYGDEGEEFIFMAGGAVNVYGHNLSSSAGQSYDDVYILNTQTKAFSQCTPGLPDKLFYGQGEWNEATAQFVIYGGVTSPAGTAETSETYFDSLYVLSFPEPVTCGAGYSVTTVPINPAGSTPGRKYHLIELIDNYVYVFGGYNAAAPLTQSQLWFKLSIATGAYFKLQTTAVNSNWFPQGVISPVVVEDEGEGILFFYSGMTAPPGVTGSSFAQPGLMWRYSWNIDEWLAPIQPYVGSTSLLVTGYPNVAFACHTHTADDETWFYIGGTDGQNSLETILMIDMSTDSTIGIPTMTILYSELPGVGLTHPACGLGLGGEIVVMTGFSAGPHSSIPISTDPKMGPYPTAVFLAELPLLAESVTLDPFSSFITTEDATEEWAVTGHPARREGAAYGSDGTTVYMAGGAYITAQSTLLYTDVWGLNAVTDAYTQYNVNLPSPTYHGTGQWSNNVLYIWGGRTNALGAGSFNTYNNAFMKVNFGSSPPTVTSTTLTSVSGTQNAASVIMGSQMFIWGGTAGNTGFTGLSAQQWFSININTNAVTTLSHNCIADPTGAGICDYPGSIYVAPVLFTSSAGRYVYLYSGMTADYASWNNPFDVFVFDTQQGLWLVDVEPYLSPYSNVIAQMPNMALGGVARSTDGNHILIVGGTEGDTSVNGAGSHQKIFHIDATPLSTNGQFGRPLITILYASLPKKLEAMVVGLTKNNQELIVWGGAQYFNSELDYPISYSGSLYEVYEAELPVNPTSSTTSSTTTNNHGTLSGGQIAGIVVGSILGTALIMVCFFFLMMRYFGVGTTRGGGGSWTKQGDSEMSSRA